MDVTELLGRHARSATSSWLSQNPTGAEGDPVICIKQSFFVEPIKEVLDRTNGQDVILCRFEDCSARVAEICAVVARGDRVQDVWSLDARQPEMAGFRAPYFEIAHDETYIRLVNSLLCVMTARSGSYITLFHFEQGSLMISDADPSFLAEPTFEGITWQAGACTATLPPAGSQHGHIQRAAIIAKMNAHLPALQACAGSAKVRPRVLQNPLQRNEPLSV